MVSHDENDVDLSKRILEAEFCSESHCSALFLSLAWILLTTLLEFGAFMVLFAPITHLLHGAGWQVGEHGEMTELPDWDGVGIGVSGGSTQSSPLDNVCAHL